MEGKTQKVKTFFNEPGNYLDNNLGIALRSKLIRNGLPVLKGKKILDVGCGNGEMTMHYIGENTITFIDISERMLDIVKSNIPTEYIRNAEFINQDFQEYSTSSKYDYIIVIGLLAHVSSIEKTISRLTELLNDDGVLVIQFTDSSNFVSILVRLIFEIKKKFGKKPVYKINYTSSGSLKKLLEKHTLSIDRHISYWPALPGFIILPVRIRKLIYYKILGSKILCRFGGEKIYFLHL